jgi:hypothetical protein
MGKTKGTIVLAAVKVLRSRRQESASLLPDSLHHYLQERIVVSAWYPEQDLYALLVACAALFPGGDSAFEMLGAHTARDHSEGMYSDFLSLGAAARARMMWKTQHDSGDLVLTEETPHSATYELHGWEHASPKYCRIVGGYFTEVHRQTGASSPTYTHPVCRALKGDRCVYVIRWE